MPHSSGGGSSGGGFHGGSGSSGGSSHRTSSRPFPGAYCYVYFDSRGRSRAIYTNADPRKSKPKIGPYILMGVLLLVPAVIIPLVGNHNPKKLPTDYDTSIRIQDDLHVLSEQELPELNTTFAKFFDLSGICPSFVSISNGTWRGHYSSLQNYAYDKYINSFKDESHWLLVYSSDDAKKTNYYFEGMQGNDTDGVLTGRVTEQFTRTCLNYLSDPSVSVGKAINDAMASMLPTLMEHSFYVEPSLWVFMAIWEAGIALSTVFVIIGDVRMSRIKNATKVEGQPKKMRCEGCGYEYYDGTIEVCPKCGHDVSHPHYAHFENEVK